MKPLKYLKEFGMKEIPVYFLGFSMGIFLTLSNSYSPEFRESMHTIGVIMFIIGAGGLIISSLLKILYTGDNDE